MAFAEIVDRSLHATAASALRFGSICMVVGANLQNRARSPGICATHSDQSSEINTNDALIKTDRKSDLRRDCPHPRSLIDACTRPCP